MKKSAIVMACLLLCACAHRYSGPAYYSLGDDINGRAISAKQMSVDVGRIKIPEYMDRPQIVTTNGVSVNISQDDRWAENLSPMLGRRIMDGIRTRMTGASVKSTDFISVPADYAVFIEIYRLDGNIPGQVQMDATYSINEQGGNTLRTRRVQYDTECGDSYADYVHSMGVLVDMLSRDISRDLSRLEK